MIVRLIDVYVEQPACRRALHRYGAPHRPRPLQGARLCRGLIKNRTLVDDRWRLLRDATTLAAMPVDGAGHRAARPVARASATRCSPAATSACGLRPATIPDAHCRRRRDYCRSSPSTSRSSPTAAATRSARLLRERHGFAGELRAVGDVLRDQLFALGRVRLRRVRVQRGPRRREVADCVPAFPTSPASMRRRRGRRSRGSGVALPGRAGCSSASRPRARSVVGMTGPAAVGTRRGIMVVDPCCRP